MHKHVRTTVSLFEQILKHDDYVKQQCTKILPYIKVFLITKTKKTRKGKTKRKTQTRTHRYAHAIIHTKKNRH